jgi:hypothetical protein
VLASGFDELSKFASSLLPFARDMVGEFSDGEYAVGVTEDVVAFANTIAMHPETWLDFPLADEDEDEDEDDGKFLVLVWYCLIIDPLVP